MTKVGINGFGRIGRLVFRAALKRGLDIVAINDLIEPDYMAYMLKYDTTHGRFDGTVEVKDGQLVVNGKTIRITAERDPANLKWDEVGVEIVIESTGLFLTRADANKHIAAGAKRVVLSAPGDKDVDATIVYGVNESVLKAGMTVVSNASCTTNALAPVAKVLNDKIGIEHGLMTTIHAFTNDQVLTDVYHSDARRARSAVMSMIPTKTGAAANVGLVVPELLGKLDGLAVRVPTINVSLVDLTFTAKRATTKEEINSLMKEASEGALKGILAYNEQKLVSMDFNHTSASSTFDATQTRVDGNLVKIFAWYDNEWGFSNRMLDTAKALVNAK